MSKRILRWLIALPLLAAATACVAPRPVVRLEARGPNVLWVSGRAVTAAEQAGVRAAAAFDHQEGDMAVFRVELENQTAVPLEISPRAMTFAACVSQDTCRAARQVFDPEEVLVALDLAEAKGKADATNQAVFNGSLMLLSAVTDVAAVASGKADRSTGHNTARLGAQMDADEARHGHAMSQIELHREQWSTTALRRTTLLPGGSLAGYVYVPIDVHARYVWLFIPAGSRRFRFPFAQVVHRQPTAPPAASSESDRRRY